MGEVVLKMHVSLDGYVRGPDGDVMDWVFATMDDTLAAWEVELLWSASLHIMGRALYEEMADYWPTSTEPYAPPMNQIPKLIFSRSLREATWHKSRVTQQAPGAELANLRATEAGVLLVHGGASLAQSLAAEGLIDRYHLIVHPVALGGGLPLFAAPATLQLGGVRAFPGGAVLLTYERAAPPAP